MTAAHSTARAKIQRLFQIAVELLTTLSRFPSALVEERFTRLLGDKKWSYRMKRKFQAILQGANWRYL